MQTKPQVRIRYVVDRIDEVTAIFIDSPGTNDPYSMQCYAHIGQHSSCSMEWYNCDTKGAKPEQFKSLHQELLRIYDDCDLYIVNKIDRKALQNRIAELNRIK